MDDREPIEPGEEELFDLPENAREANDRRQRLDADFVLDRVIPGEIDWRDLVRRHPLISVGSAAAVGLLIGRSKGTAILAGMSAALSAAVMRQLADVLDGDVFEF